MLSRCGTYVSRRADLNARFGQQADYYWCSRAVLPSSIHFCLQLHLVFICFVTCCFIFRPLILSFKKHHHHHHHDLPIPSHPTSIDRTDRPVDTSFLSFVLLSSPLSLPWSRLIWSWSSIQVGVLLGWRPWLIDWLIAGGRKKTRPTQLISIQESIFEKQAPAFRPPSTKEEGTQTAWNLVDNQRIGIVPSQQESAYPPSTCANESSPHRHVDWSIVDDRWPKDERFPFPAFRALENKRVNWKSARSALLYCVAPYEWRSKRTCRTWSQSSGVGNGMWNWVI